MTKLILAAIVLATPGALAAQTPADSPLPTVVVRSYKHGLTAGQFATVRDLVGGILGQAGIGTSWRECWPDSPAPARVPPDCDRPLQHGEVILRLVVAGRSHSIDDQSALGFALVDSQQGSGSVATVYMDRVVALARDGRSDTTDVLARAIAHEIGHLLIGTNRHSSRGLMRAVWSPAELRRGLAGDWRFSEEEAQMMRCAARSRSIRATAEMLMADGR